MSYRFQSHQSIASNVKRIANEQVEDAVHQLTTRIKGNRAKAIHSARKHFKKIRALVRLVRDDVGKEAYKQENVCFRDAGRQLSDVRDAQVRVETLDDLVSHYQALVDVEQFDPVRQVLVKAYDQAKDSALPSQEAIATLVSDIEEGNARIQNWTIHNHWQALESNVERVYRRGYDDFFTACETPTPEHLHEWRKRVKYLWYHLRLLSPSWPRVMNALKHEVKSLSDLLGDDHDLANFRSFIVNDPEKFGSEKQVGLLLALIQRRQLELQTQARFLGQRLYADEPQVFTSRLQEYWMAWQTEHDQSPILLPSESEYIHDLPTAALHRN